VKVHIVTGAVSAAQNVVKCVRRCGLEVNDLILQPLASSRAVLSEDEKDLGVCLLDIGGGTTDIAVFTHGAIRHTAVIPIAGDQITNDIAMALRTPTPDAENIKIRHGVALRQLANANDMIEVPGIGERAPRSMSRQTLAEVIEPRVEELFSLVQQVLRESGFEELLSSGVVLIGVGGAGGNAVNHMIEQGVEGVEFIVINTDAQVLSRNKSRNQIQLGTSGLGSGARPEEARAVAVAERERLEEAVAGAHMVFITAGMGGGTGTGAAPVIAEVARSLGILTVAVVTKPFTFEGSKRMKTAEQGLE